jgi:hypothetical protein
VGTGVFVFGMHRSGTSAVTRLVNLLGVPTTREDDLVPPSRKNPSGYWESMSLVAVNTRVLSAVGSDISCPLALGPGWEHDARLDALRPVAREAFRAVMPAEPWVWKDPRTCLTFSFWRSALGVRPVVVLVTRNPLEIVASAQRLRDAGKIYELALWERYLRLALGQIGALPVLVANYGAVVSDPRAWCRGAFEFLTGLGVTPHPLRDDEVLSFVDNGLRHSEYSEEDLLNDSDVSGAQLALFLALEQLEGPHDRLVVPDLPAETPTTEPLLAERRHALEVQRELRSLLDLERESPSWARARSSRYAAPARRLRVGLRRLASSVRSSRARLEQGAPAQESDRGSHPVDTTIGLVAGSACSPRGPQR